MNNDKYLVSFGLRYGTPKHNGATIIDLTLVLKDNPYHNKQLRHLLGTDPDVQRDIEKTPNFESIYTELKKQIEAATGVVYIGCSAGRHRSVYIAERAGKELDLPVFHRDKNRRR